MRFALALTAATALAQSPLAPSPVAFPVVQATHMTQLMESTAVAVPDLVRASEPLRHQAEATLAVLRDNPSNTASEYRFIAQTKAYLALTDTFPASELPETAIRQFGELREDLALFQQYFETSLTAGMQTRAASDSDPNGLLRYADVNTKLPPLGTLPRVVFLGDGIPENWHLNETFPGHEFINRGIDGQTSTQTLGRFLQDAVSTHPKAVVILAGSVDIAHGIPAAGTEDSITMMAELAKLHGIKPIFASALPADSKIDRAPDLNSLNRWIKDFCEREGFVYLDLSTALGAGGKLPADLTTDGHSLNPRAYGIFTAITLEAVNRTLTPGGVAPAPHRRLPTGK